MVLSCKTSTLTFNFYCIILVYKLPPLNWREKKELSKGEIDRAKSIHEAHSLMTQIITLKAQLK